MVKWTVRVAIGGFHISPVLPRYLCCGRVIGVVVVVVVISKIRFCLYFYVLIKGMCHGRFLCVVYIM